MWDALREDLAAGRRVVAGVLSGTSADGVDVGLVRPILAGGRVVAVECVAFATEPFDGGAAAASGPERAGAAELAERVRAVLERRVVPGPRELALLDRDLGRAFGRAARAVAARHGYRLGLVASHGQTVWHHDGREPSGPATLQLGDGDEVAEAAGCAVACDFRRRDVAAGGEGAPLSALADPVVFARAPRPLCLLNLGGIANLTLVREGPAGPETRAFDVGPANALLDGLARAVLGRAYDEDGAAAALGRPHEGLVDGLLAHPFFALPAPKSTGRDTFGGDWLAGVAAQAAALGLSAPDVLASAALVVARSVARDVRSWGGWLGDDARPGPLLVAGGGVHHRPLMSALARELEAAPGRPVASSAEVGVPPDAREALVFAVLGVRCLLGEPSTLPGATGARPGRVLGKLCGAPPGPVSGRPACGDPAPGDG